MHWGFRHGPASYLRDIDIMREVHRSQFQLGQVAIEEIWINPKSRDDIPAVLKGLQQIWCDEELRERLFGLLDEHILPEADRTVGRPGMDLWQILVLGVLKQGLGCDFDRIHELTNHHDTIRAFLGHSDFGDKTHYEYQTVVDNVSLLTPELLSAVARLVVESGHKVAKKSLASHCAGGVIRSWSKPTCIIRPTSTCCGTRCGACCGRRGGRLRNMRWVAGVSGGICAVRSRNCSTRCARRGGRSGIRSGWRRMCSAAGRWLSEQRQRSTRCGTRAWRNSPVAPSQALSLMRGGRLTRWSGVFCVVRRFLTRRRVRLFFVGGRISLCGSEAGGNWIRHGVVREQRRGPVADGTCAVSDGWGCSAGTRALGGGSQYASMRRRPVATAAKCHRAPVDSHPVAGQMPTGLQ